MIKIVWERHRGEAGCDRYVVTADGHAGAGTVGNDIVCAAVSVLMDTLCECLLCAASAKVIHDPRIKRENGHYRIEVALPDKWTYEGVEAYSVLTTVLRGLRLVEEAYPAHVRIQTQEG